MLGSGLTGTFSRWFGQVHPTHERIVAFIRDPKIGRAGGAREDELAGRCPICRFPTAVLDPHPERLSLEARRELQADHPSWRLEQSLCAQCADLYQARHAQSRSRDRGICLQAFPRAAE